MINRQNVGVVSKTGAASSMCEGVRSNGTNTLMPESCWSQSRDGAVQLVHAVHNETTGLKPDGEGDNVARSGPCPQCPVPTFFRSVLKTAAAALSTQARQN